MTSAQVVETSVNVITNSSSQLLPTPRRTIIDHNPMSVRPGSQSEHEPGSFCCGARSPLERNSPKTQSKNFQAQLSELSSIL